MSEQSSPPDVRPLADINQVIHAPARLMILAYLYVVESVDYVFLMRITGLTWGNLSTHLTKLEEAGYIEITKGYRGKKPHTTIRLSNQGRVAFQQYKQSLQKVLDDLPD
ncbi:MAG: transcriptional regulator [candidate division Zixibacteria bacterium]|nr:transcriptional regulator [candidate division Zixibacteria bacterium]